MRFGEQMIAVAVGWQVYSIRHNPLDLGLIGLAEFLPLPLLALPAGQLADRVSRRVIFAASLCVYATVAALLLVVTIHGASALWPYFALAGSTGIVNAICWPAYGALAPELVPAELLPGAMALRSVAGQMAVVVGPAVGGVVFAIRPELVYVVASSLFGVALVSVLALRTRGIAASGEAAAGFAAVVAGLRFVVRTRMLLGAIALDLFAVLFGGATALLPVFARTILHVGPVGLGVLRSSFAVGALLAALILARKALPYRAGPTLLVVVVFLSASNELGAFESGAVASLVGTATAVVAGGVATIAVALSWTRLFPELSRMGRLEDLRPEPV
jgi:MFS family permease